MDEKTYSEKTISAYMNDNFFFKDATLRKYYEEDDLQSFRKRLVSKHPKESLENMMYAIVTDHLRDIIYGIISKLTVFLKNSADVIITGGEAVNRQLDRDDRIVTSDIDTKLIPRMVVDKKFFGKLQALKLVLWNKLGEIAKQYGPRIKKRLSRSSRFFKFLGIGFSSVGPYVTRRYTLKNKKKTGEGNKPALKNILIDVEIFALDLKINYFSIEHKKVEKFNLGGILDIAMMRPGEFGYEVVESKDKTGVTYFNPINGKLIHDKKIIVARRQFLIDDIYLMQKLGLRPAKREKDRKRILKLTDTYNNIKTIKSSDSLETIYKKFVSSAVGKTPKQTPKSIKNIGFTSALKASPFQYKNYTTEPRKEKLLSQYTTGALGNKKPVGYRATNAKMRFNVNTRKWIVNKSPSYVRDQYNFRKKVEKELPKVKELYGYSQKRDMWIPKKIVTMAANIPFIGLKN